MNNLRKLIMLGTGFVVILIVGIFLIINNNSDGTKKNEIASGEVDHLETNESNVSQEVGSEDNQFYYDEALLKNEDQKNRLQGRYTYCKGKPMQLSANDETAIFIPANEAEEVVPLNIKREIYDRTYGYTYSENALWTAEFDKETQTVYIYAYDDNGDENSKIKLKDYSGYIGEYGPSIYDMRVSNNYIYLQVGTHDMPFLLVYNRDGSLLRTHKFIEDFEIDDSDHYIISSESSEEFPYSGYFMFEASTGQEIFRNTNILPNQIRFNADYSKLYVMRDKIYEVDLETGKEKPIFEFGVDTSYVLDDYYVLDLFIDSKERLYVSLRTQGNSERKYMIFEYTQVAGSRPNRETTLVLTAPYRSDFMSEAIKRYEMKYPTEHIEYEFAYNTYEEYSKNKIEYGEKLALNILSGEVGDIVQTGDASLSYYSLAQTDAFENIEPLLNGLSNKDTLNWSVLNGLKINNAIRALPLSYIFYQQEINMDLVKELNLDIDYNDLRWSDLLSLLSTLESKSSDIHLFSRYSTSNTFMDNFFASVLVMNMPDLIDIEKKTVNLNQEWFLDILKQIKEINHHEQLVLTDAEYDRLNSLHGSLIANWDSTWSPQDGMYHYASYNQENNSVLIPGIRGEKNNNRIAYSRLMYSISARSERKEKAWAFLSFLLTDEIQGLSALKNPPINNIALEKKLKEGEDNFDSEVDLVDLQAYSKAYMQNSAKIDYLYDYDYMKLDIATPISKYFENALSLEEAIKQAEESIKIRLNE